MFRKIFITTLFSLCVAVNTLSAQEIPSIQTDRPDQTETPNLVPAKYFQLESGFNYEKVDNAENNYLYPTILWKYGVNNNFELRLITELATNQLNRKSVTGFNPVKVGFKANLCKESGIIPLTSFIAHLSVPQISGKAFRTKYFAPTFRFTMQHTLTEKISLGYNLGAEWDGDVAYPAFIYTVTTGFSLSKTLGAYIELYGFAPQDFRAEHRADGGITFLVKNNILLDISGGVGLSKQAPNYYGSLGFSIRLPG